MSRKRTWFRATTWLMGNRNEAGLAASPTICRVAICGRTILLWSVKLVVLAKTRILLTSQNDGSFSLSAKALIFLGARTACKAFRSGVSKSIFDLSVNKDRCGPRYTNVGTEEGS